MYDSRSATHSSVTYQGSVRRLCCQVRVRITRVFSNSMPATLLPQQFGVSRWSFQQLWSLTHANPTHYTGLSFHHITRKHQHRCFSFNLDELLGEHPCYRTAHYIPTRIHCIETELPRIVRILNVFQESEMVRETSQWEREEMEKVVSERKKCCPIRLGGRWLYLSNGPQVLVVTPNKIQGWALNSSGSCWSVLEWMELLLCSLPQYCVWQDSYLACIFCSHS